MALDRVWTLLSTGQDDSTPERLWVRHANTSPLAGIGTARLFEDAETGDTVSISPVSTVTIRMRYRRDVSLVSVFRDPDGRSWFVNEMLEIGRRRWLDVSITTYEDATSALPMIPSRTFNPPTGWGLVDEDNNAIGDLRIENNGTLIQFANNGYRGTIAGAPTIYPATLLRRGGESVIGSLRVWASGGTLTVRADVDRFPVTSILATATVRFAPGTLTINEFPTNHPGTVFAQIGEIISITSAQ